MTTVFADTSYYLALLLPYDSAHGRASALTAGYDGHMITTTGVLAELGNFFSPTSGRRHFVRVVHQLRVDPDVTVVDLDARLFDLAFSLYERRLDQAWSFVDCASFVVMRERGLSDALTADHHFEQAGFRALLR